MFEKCILPNTSIKLTIYKAHLIIFYMKQNAKIHKIIIQNTIKLLTTKCL